MTQSVEAVKRCTKCKEIHDVQLFRPHKRSADGLGYWCRHCESHASKLRARRAYARNPEPIRQAAYEWRKKNPEKVRQMKAADWNSLPQERRQERYRASWAAIKADPAKRLHKAMRWRLWSSLVGRNSGRRTFEILGYSLDELRAHLERQFTKGMSWDNYGEWHVDHIVPLAEFGGLEIESPEFRRAWALTNLRPLWAQENLRKKDKRLTLL